MATATLSFIFSTFLLSPDLDLSGSIPTKNWGILRVLWIGYPKIFRHRGKSHSLFFSGLTKVIYLLGVAAVLVCLYVVVSNLVLRQEFEATVSHVQHDLGAALDQILQQVSANKTYILAALIGVTMSDWIHILTDRFLSTYKRFT